MDGGVPSIVTVDTIVSVWLRLFATLVRKGYKDSTMRAHYGTNVFCLLMNSSFHPNCACLNEFEDRLMGHISVTGLSIATEPSPSPHDNGEADACSVFSDGLFDSVPSSPLSIPSGVDLSCSEDDVFLVSPHADAVVAPVLGVFALSGVPEVAAAASAPRSAVGAIDIGLFVDDELSSNFNTPRDQWYSVIALISPPGERVRVAGETRAVLLQYPNKQGFVVEKGSTKSSCPNSVGGVLIV